MQFVVLTSLRTLDMHISMPIFMLVSGFFVVSMFFTKATQVQPTDVLNSQSRCATAFKNPWQERFEIRPNPVEQVCLSHVAKATETPIRFEQVSGLARLLRGFGVLRSSLNEAYQGQRRLCSLLDAKRDGLSHGKSWIATIEDTIRQEQPFLQAWLGQRVCYVYDESVTEDATL